MGMKIGLVACYVITELLTGMNRQAVRISWDWLKDRGFQQAYCKFMVLAEHGEEEPPAMSVDGPIDGERDSLSESAAGSGDASAAETEGVNPELVHLHGRTLYSGCRTRGREEEVAETTSWTCLVLLSEPVMPGSCRI